jgi:hypothetical protein
MVYLPGTLSGTAISSGAAVIFSQIVNNDSRGTIVFNPVTGTVQINDTGFYQVTFGVSQISSTTVSGIWQLEINGVAPPPQQILELAQVASTGVTTFLHSLTNIIYLTTSGSILTLINNSGAVRTLNNVSTTSTGGPAAYMTIVKLK